MSQTENTTLTQAELEELLAAHREKVTRLTAAKRDASYHERRIRELTEQLHTK